VADVQGDPLGWRQVGPVGTKAECLAYVEEAWPDITPLSVRRRWLKRRQSASKAARAKLDPGIRPGFAMKHRAGGGPGRCEQNDCRHGHDDAA
jgi:hypothetical protein